jgi:hypothetical protein
MIATSEDQTDKEGYWISELTSLAVEPWRKNELNDVGELEALANPMKQAYYQDYKTAFCRIDPLTCRVVIPHIVETRATQKGLKTSHQKVQSSAIEPLYMQKSSIFNDIL